MFLIQKYWRVLKINLNGGFYMKEKKYEDYTVEELEHKFKGSEN